MEGQVKDREEKYGVTDRSEVVVFFKTFLKLNVLNRMPIR